MATPRRRKGVSPVYLELARAAPLERFQLIRRGLPPGYVMDLAFDLRLNEDNLMVYLGLSSGSVRRKLHGEERLTPGESDGVMALAVLLGNTLVAHDATVAPLAEAQVASVDWLGKWLRSPLSGLEHRAPLQFMDVGCGRALVAGLLAQALVARRRR